MGPRERQVGGERDGGSERQRQRKRQICLEVLIMSWMDDIIISSVAALVPVVPWHWQEASSIAGRRKAVL